MNEKQRELIRRLLNELDFNSVGVDVSNTGRVGRVTIDASLTLVELKTLVDYLEAIEAAADA